MNGNPQISVDDGGQLAAVDLGSNSFHLIIARFEHGELRPMITLSEKVQLGAGLEEDLLSAAAIERGLECLTRFSQMLQSVEPQRLRVVGTQALRRARNRREFTEPARRILGSPVEVIYGREEARLVYLGVAHTLADDAHSRLVVDIGGGSTEFIVGQRFEPRHLESLQMGCVTYTREFFPNGRVSKSSYRKAMERASLEVSHIRRSFNAGNWQDCVGSSGTLRAIESILLAHGWSDDGITPAGLERMRKQLLRWRDFDAFTLEGLNDARRNVIAAGLAIAEALFSVLGIRYMRTSPGALREGVMYDLIGRLRHEDVRERSISALLQRYNADEETARVVARRARMLFSATRERWQLSAEEGDLLERAALTHEIGMAISHKHFHHHSAYLLRNSDLPGFSQAEQEWLAVLAAGQRGKLRPELLSELASDDGQRLQRLLALLRLAMVFKYVEQLEQLPDFTMKVSTRTLRLVFPSDWLTQHPLTQQELQREKATLERLGLRLQLSSRNAKPPQDAPPAADHVAPD
jgi:exopolyphosphatase/guanosine-5'-triphosphate,3'-diphosphate pyrophosphatase